MSLINFLDLVDSDWLNIDHVKRHVILGLVLVATEIEILHFEIPNQILMHHLASAQSGQGNRILELLEHDFQNLKIPDSDWSIQ